MMTMRKLAAAAAADIREHGWHKGTYMSALLGDDGDTCPVCVLGAMNRSLGLSPDDDPSALYEPDKYPVWNELYSEFIDRTGEAPHQFNDRVETTKDDVLRVLDEIAAS